jgi:tryptophan 2,3-dioxygenase
MAANQGTTYWDYLKLEDLLSLQTGIEGDESRLADEEVLFITVHQVFELWFKLVVRGLATARDLFSAETVAEQELSAVVERLRRIRTILRVAVQHFEVVETLGTRDYLRFRTKLMPASGFQSAQMRQVEILLGLEERERIPYGSAQGHLAALRNRDGSESPALKRVEAQLADVPTLKQAIEGWLFRTPIDGYGHDHPEADTKLRQFLDRFLAAYESELDASRERALALSESAADAARLREMYDQERANVRRFFEPAEEEGGFRRARVRAAMVFIETYRDLPLLAWPREVLAALIELEQSFLIFRQRHARMVERVIGRRTGTGGTSGVEYLDQTALRYRIFADLWAVRTLMIRPEAAPSPERPEFYGFRSL